MAKLNEKILNYIKTESSIKDINANEKDKYMLVKTLILANPVIGKITSMSGINMIANKLDGYSENDLNDYMENRYKYLNTIIRELLASEIIRGACKDLLYYDEYHKIKHCLDNSQITHQVVDDYTINTVVETKWLKGTEIKSIRFNLDEFLKAIAMEYYRSYMVVEFIEGKLKSTIPEDEIIDEVLKYPIFLNNDIDKLNYII